MATLLKTCDHHKNRWTGSATVVSNYQVARDTWRIRLNCPEIAAVVRPGQFLMLRLPDKTDPLLARAFALYDANTATGEIDALYIVVGKMTRLLTTCIPGSTMSVTGPLGNGWDLLEEDAYSRYGKSQYATDTPPLHVVMVAGGIGQTPFYLFSKEHRTAPFSKAQLTLILGAKSADRICCREEFEELGVNVIVATEDGSEGYKGYVTDLIEKVVTDAAVRIPQTHLLACGPNPMLKAVAQYSKNSGVKCWVSLESSMACGLGICYGCAIEYLENDNEWDYKRVCMDGPVFDAWRLKWN